MHHVNPNSQAFVARQDILSADCLGTTSCLRMSTAAFLMKLPFLILHKEKYNFDGFDFFFFYFCVF